MFEVADVDKNGVLSLEEFKHFLRTENQAVMMDHQQAIRNAVADNIEQHDGQLVVVSGNKSVQVNCPVNVEALRKGKPAQVNK